MPQRNVATNFTFEQQRTEINSIAEDYWTFQGNQTTANATFLKADGTVATTAALTLGGHLNVPNAFTINSNSGNGTVTINGNLQVDGTTTTVNTATMDVVDKNITIAKGSANDAAADGAGITIDSATDITFNFVDAKDALVSSIGLEATTTLVAGGLASLKGAQFAGTQTAATGVGVEITQPDANTGNIQAYDRTNSAFKDLRVKGASVGFYAGSTNVLVGAFHNTGLTMESGKTITGDLTGTASKVNLNSNNDATAFRVPFTSGNSGSVDLYADNSDGMTYKPSDGTLSVQKLEGTVVTAAQPSITSVGTLTGLDLGDNNITNVGEISLDTIKPDNTNVTINMGTDKNVSFSGGIGEIDNVTGFQTSNDAGSANTAFGIRANDIRLATGSAERFRVANDGQVRIGSEYDSNRASHICQISQAANTSSVLSLHNPTSSSGQGIKLGFYARNSNNAAVEYGRVQTIAETTTANSTQKGYISLFTNIAGTMTERLRCAGSGQIDLGFDGTNQAQFCQAGKNHYIVGQAADNVAALEVYSQHGSSASKISFGVYDNRTGSKSASFMVLGNGTIKIPAVSGTNTNADLPVLFQTAGDIIEGGSGLTYNPGGDTLKVNGLVISQGGINGNASSMQLSCANHSSTCNIIIGSVITTKANVEPSADNADNLGSATKRWANVYTADLQMNNTGTGGNEVDGSEGRWTMQEGSDDLFLINRNTGKKYKFNLTEVS